MYVCEVQGMSWALEAESYADGGRSNPDGMVEVEGDKERPSVQQLPAISWGTTKTTAAPEW
jgi:hypothetical protein